MTHVDYLYGKPSSPQYIPGKWGLINLLEFVATTTSSSESKSRLQQTAPRRTALC